jgi:hypothetical protein
MRALPLILLATAMSACTSARLDRVGTVPVIEQVTLAAPAVEKANADATPAVIPSTTAPLPLIGGKGYTRFSLGSFMPAGDIDALDDGFYGDVAFGTELLPFLAIEGSLGYLQVDGSNDQELTAIPLLVQGRLQLPILILEAYAGVGVGGLYADYELGFGLGSDSEFLLAGSGFVGLEVGLGNLAVGLEYRYLVSEESDPGLAIEGHSGLVTLTLPF